MSDEPGTPRKRVPIAERREQILDAALIEFSQKGLHGGTTVSIAKEVGISHPNLFRVFPTKHELFVAVLERVFAAIEVTMLAAGERESRAPLRSEERRVGKEGRSRWETGVAKKKLGVKKSTLANR